MQPPRGIVVREAHFPGRAPVDAYGDGGFRFAGMSHRGGILCLPDGIHGWHAAVMADLDPAAFALPIAAAGAFELLLLGTGARFEPVDGSVRAALAEAGIRLEVMSTGAAVRTFNVLLAEERAVAAALLPVP